MTTQTNLAEAGAGDSFLKGISRTLSRTDIAFVVILVAWIFIVVLPLVILFAFSFFTTEYYETVYKPTLDTWIGLFSSGRFEVAFRTLRLALTVTLIEFALGYPFALWLAKARMRSATRAIYLAMLTIPFFLDTSSRTIIWRAILGQAGLINTILMHTGLVAHPVEWLLYSEFSVHFGLIVALYPTMVLPAYLAISLIDDTLLEASKDLGATPRQTLTRVVLPLSLPGVLAGIVFTMGSALAAWVEPGMLGGGFVNLLSNSIESAYTALRYPVVAALSAFVILLLLVLLALMYPLMRMLGFSSLTLKS
ncbi:spermidine/putrescine transport system permease protein [Arboricoccus pini]|uniref:Spermidine/putrescine transport system permease protein n=1 Tax=Arboricoccus pini TaxID=1963835 RepID=A0A212Q081_9PROT|nr:ABC transporter permease [Arboricoccus pini]SNB52722.1 spermidine/putrescine transport system permease protein [Arboricoccus pini]